MYLNFNSCIFNSNIITKKCKCCKCHFLQSWTVWAMQWLHLNFGHNFSAHDVADVHAKMVLKLIDFTVSNTKYYFWKKKHYFPSVNSILWTITLYLTFWCQLKYLLSYTHCPCCVFSTLILRTADHQFLHICI